MGFILFMLGTNFYNLGGEERLSMASFVCVGESLRERERD